MCSVPKPKTPKVEPIPQRMASVLPDAGDPAVRQNLKRRQRLTSSAMIFSQQGGTLGMPTTSTPMGTSGL